MPAREKRHADEPPVPAESRHEDHESDQHPGIPDEVDPLDVQLAHDARAAGPERPRMWICHMLEEMRGLRNGQSEAAP